MIDLNSISLVWGEILKLGQATLDELRERVEKKSPDVAKNLEEILLHLHKLYMVDFDGYNVTIPEIIDPEIMEIPCLGCEKLKTCKPGSRNNPFRCEKFVKWFIQKFAE